MRDGQRAACRGTRGATIARGAFNRHFLTIWFGQVVSQLGDQAYLVAVMAWLVESGSSATAAGVLTMSTALPGVLIGPFAGALVDRWPRLAVIQAADVARGLAMFVVPAVIWATRTTAPPLPLLYGVALVSGAGTAFFRPAIAAVIPDLVPSTSLPVANSMSARPC
ncbi:MAG: MFS transporter [Actinobacteria bacterium]|nr:MAG: MFS transporter [Actinomycetota bacterium]